MAAKHISDELYRLERDGWTIEVRREAFEEIQAPPPPLPQEDSDSPLHFVAGAMNAVAQQYAPEPELIDSFEITVKHRDHGEQKLLVAGDVFDDINGAVQAMRDIAMPQPRPMGLGRMR